MNSEVTLGALIVSMKPKGVWRQAYLMGLRHSSSSVMVPSTGAKVGTLRSAGLQNQNINMATEGMAILKVAVSNVVRRRCWTALPMYCKTS